ncbi:hypothetical protein [Nannocystis sp. SCPEA4]|uniref:hypothetical protein n=1 Tax=Nannocystis sp. SCPEA4 TaxID=2996787 RepID=UPI002270F3CE|nr:hypothetical protein [Nannocystis sp. SCPEA4]MCY1061785.1 hypothetical protein [Nannocystis sp. SCPEA4]
MTRAYARLWELLDASMPDPNRFDALVAEQSADQLVELYADVIDASAEVRVKWEGPYIPELDACLSEDSCEDLTDWIVGQGHDYWSRACGADDEALAAMWQESVREREAGRGRWTARTPPIGPKFFSSYARRFDNDDGQFLEAVEAELDARAQALAEDE